MSINVLIVEDEALLRDGLKSLLKKEDFVQEIYEAWDLKTFTNQLTTKQVDLILLDIRLSGTNGVELLEVLKAKPTQPKVVAVTGLEGVELIINLLKSGVHGIVFKLDGYVEIIKAIHSVLKAENYFPEKILKIIQSNAYRWDDVPPVTLSFQDKEILKAIANGLTTKEIALQLKMTEATTETYRMRLIKKLGLSNTAGLLAYSYRNGIL